MARKCEISSKGKQKGNNVSHALNRTIKHWKPNLRKVRVLVNGKPKTLKVSIKSYKDIKRNKVKGVKLANPYTQEIAKKSATKKAE